MGFERCINVLSYFFFFPRNDRNGHFSAEKRKKKKKNYIYRLHSNENRIKVKKENVFSFASILPCLLY